MNVKCWSHAVEANIENPRNATYTGAVLMIWRTQAKTNVMSPLGFTIQETTSHLSDVSTNGCYCMTLTTCQP